MNYIAKQWETDKLHCILVIFWLLTVLASFAGDCLLPIEVPGIGTWFAFRTLLPLTVVLYVVCAIRDKAFFWRESTTLEKWCYVFIVLLLFCCVLSVPRAIDVQFTIRKIFNLIFDLAFFFLVLQMCRDKTVRRLTLYFCGAALGVIMLLGVYEVFFGGLFSAKYDILQYFRFFSIKGQPPTVFSTNTNDYNSIIVLLIAVLLVDIFGTPKEEPSKGKLWYLFFAFVVGYFLALAGEARLCEIGYFILLTALFVCAFLWGKKCRWVPILILCCVIGVQFASRIHYIVPQAKAYVQSLSDPDKADMDFLDIFRDPASTSIGNEFVTVDDKTGEKTLNESGSAGVRMKLVLHAGRCFLDSKGLGVGIGNTEILARDNDVIKDHKIWSIHCFLARIVADCGIFALIPLCVIAFLLLKKQIRCMNMAARKKEKRAFGSGLLLLATLISYPIVSTASSDAQDIIAMWLFLAMLVLYTTEGLPTTLQTNKIDG